MLYLNKIITGIQNYVQIDRSLCKGFDDATIRTIEKDFMGGSVLPKALKEFLTFGGVFFSDKLEQPVCCMKFSYYKDFYNNKYIGSNFLRERILKNLGLTNDEYAVVYYYGEGDFVAIVRLIDGEDPPVYFSIYDFSNEHTPTFEIIAPSFTDWFIDRVVEDQKLQIKNNSFNKNKQ